tara:strand:+ start:1392 stop:1529 length:138 start_codon:yes stop_codon:yes gene_type:complete
VNSPVAENSCLKAAKGAADAGVMVRLTASRMRLPVNAILTSGDLD